MLPVLYEMFLTGVFWSDWANYRVNPLSAIVSEHSGDPVKQTSNIPPELQSLVISPLSRPGLMVALFCSSFHKFVSTKPDDHCINKLLQLYT